MKSATRSWEVVRPYLPGVALFLLGLVASPDRLLPSAQSTLERGGVAYVNVRLLQILLLFLGSWLALTLAPNSRFAWVLFPCLVFLGVGSLLHFGLIDDAYISLRYARNFARGLGLVFNPGERVEGYSAFLWVVLLGALHRVSGFDLTRLAFGAGILFGLATVLLTARLLSERARAHDPGSDSKRESGPFLALVLALHFPLVFWSFSGMETSLYCALLLGSTLFLFRHWRRGGRLSLASSGILLGLAALTRPETYLYFLVFWGAVFLGARTGRRWREALAYAAAFGLLVGPHLVFRYAYYRELVPNTFYVKVDYSSWSLMRHGLNYLFRGFLPHAGLLALAVLGWVASRRSPSVDRREVHFLAALVLAQLIAVVYTGADHFQEMRYYAYLVPILAVLAAPGLEHILGAAGRLNPAARRGWRSALVLALALTTFLSGFLIRRVGYESTLVVGRNITDRWGEIGTWLHTAAQPDDLLASPVVGALAYYSDLRTLDMLGLTDRTIARKRVQLGGRHKDHEKYDVDYVLARRPDFIFLGHFQCRTLADFARRPWLPVYQDLLTRLPHPDYELISGRTDGVGYSFLHRVR